MFVPTRLILACAVVLQAETPQIRIIDLATLQPGAIKQEAVEAGKSYQFLIYHRVPGRKYLVETETRSKEIKPFEIQQIPVLQPVVEVETVSISEESEKTRAAHEELKAVFDAAQKICKESQIEPQVGLLTNALEKAELAALAGGDSTNYVNLRNACKIIIRDFGAPYLAEQSIQLKTGQEYVVTITGEPKANCGEGKEAGKPDAKRVWTVVYSTGERGTWDTLYGFSFAPNKDEAFFSKSLDTTPATYAVTRKDTHSGFAFVPALFFTWYPKWGDGQNCTFGPTAGIGFDLKSPNAFFGMQWTFNRNFALVAGGVVRPEKRLNGKYQVGDTVKDNLSEEQLSETTFSTRFFFSLAFRFSKKPDGFGK
jgi:hypothetical protein